MLGVGIFLPSIDAGIPWRLQIMETIFSPSWRLQIMAPIFLPSIDAGIPWRLQIMAPAQHRRGHSITREAFRRPLLAKNSPLRIAAIHTQDESDLAFATTIGVGVVPQTLSCPPKFPSSPLAASTSVCRRS